MTEDSSAKDLRALLAAVESAGWDYARIELDHLTLVVSDGRTTFEPSSQEPATQPTARDTIAPAPAAVAHLPEEESIPEFASSSAVVTATEEFHGNVDTVTSPSIGMVWRSPKPGSPPFVEVGDTVAADDTLCIIEVMKLMTHVKATGPGTVVRIHAANGETVEFGTPLIDIAPAADTRATT
ncbi:MAG: acetyl-CoA carboxylase biotin carboxyl carrier protein subunit [Actinomycetes bacterium]